jgi:hypothetical protein
MARPGLEPGTPRFSVVQSQLSNDVESLQTRRQRVACSMAGKSASSGLSSPIREMRRRSSPNDPRKRVHPDPCDPAQRR